MECTNLVDPISCCAPGLQSYSYYFAYIPPDNLFPKPIVNQGGGLFWILSESNLSLEEQIWLNECIYLADYFKLRKKKKKQNKISFLITWYW
jgi:hypothetical protein